MSSTDIQLLQNLINNIESVELKEKLSSIMQETECHVDNKYAWEHYIVQSHRVMMSQQNKKEIGKLRAYATELMICDYLNRHLKTMPNSENSVFIHNDDLHKYEDIVKNMCDIKQICQSGFDILYINPCENIVKKIQVKHRTDKLHLETTRRNSGKNLHKNGTGHIAYDADEFDYVIVVKGSFKDYVDMEKDIIVFPVTALLSKDDDSLIVTQINKKTEIEYIQRVDEMLEIMCC